MNARAGRISKLARTLGCVFLLTTLTVQAADWQVAEAPVRFSLRLVDSPTHSEAGYLVRIPDGGLLSSPFPRTQVVTPTGKSVESYVLWHGPETGLWIVFADPGRKAKRVDVYVSPSRRLETWTPSTGLRPSPLLVADPTRNNLSDAKRLAELGKIDPRVHVTPMAGIRRAPLSVGGDQSGRPRPTSFYLHAYVATIDPGRTWISPFFQEGENEVLINGETLKAKKRTDKWGGTGQWFDLEKGLHRIEMFTASKERGSYGEGKFRGHTYLTWKTPNMSADELGGRQSPDQPDPGTPRWETRIIEDKEIVRSGQCEIESVTARDGGPIAAFSIRPGPNFWFEGEDPLAVYTFEAMREGNPDDTEYVWSFEQGARTRGPSTTWLVPGGREHRVALTAMSAKGKSTCAVPFFGYSTVATSLDNHHHRRAFRLAMQTVLEAYPVQPDPCANWGDAYWKNLLRTAEYGKGYPLLRNLFGQRMTTAAKKLSPEDRRLLEDIFLDVAPRIDPAQALNVIAAFYQAAPDGARRAELEIREAEVFLIYLDQSQKAGELLARIARQRSEQAELAKIRLGDLYFQRGELNKATRLYADVQQRVRHERNAKPRPGERGVESWKVGAVKDAAHSANVARLIEESEFLAARQALDSWERNFPLSKISEDFVLQEARLYMALTDWKRARWLLEPYCRQVDASSFLPDSAKALLRCMKGMKEPAETLSETAVMLKKRLEFHPVAQDLEAYIEKE